MNGKEIEFEGELLHHVAADVYTYNPERYWRNRVHKGWTLPLRLMIVFPVGIAAVLISLMFHAVLVAAILISVTCAAACAVCVVYYLEGRWCSVPPCDSESDALLLYADKLALAFSEEEIRYSDIVDVVENSRRIVITLNTKYIVIDSVNVTEDLRLLLNERMRCQ